MHLLVGPPALTQALRSRPEFAEFHTVSATAFDPVQLPLVTRYLDLSLDLAPQRAAALQALPRGAVALVSSVRSSLRRLFQGLPMQAQVYGTCALPYFLQRDSWEISSLQPAADAAADLAWTGRQLVRVPDQPGLVAPRILSRIVNEAYFVQGEGVATAADVDQAMRLGVNYPLGPNAWAAELGLPAVVDILQALGRQDGSDFYRVAPALAAAALAADKPHLD